MAFGLRGIAISLIVICTVGMGSVGYAVEKVKVRLRSVSGPVSVVGLGIRFPQLGSSKSASLAMLERFHVTAQKENRDTLWTVSKADDERILHRFRGPVLHLSGEMMRVGLHPVPTEISLSMNRAKKIDIIANMDVEVYLGGVLPSEMPDSWPLEALKAQAVAARTYTHLRMRERGKAVYHLESTVSDQVFDFAHSSQKLDEKKKKVASAIEATRGLILADRQGSVFPAYYHADCGGQTEEPNQVWQGGLTLGTAQDRFCPLSPGGKWTVQISLDELSGKLHNRYQGRAVSDVVRLIKSASGRVSRIFLAFTDGTQESMTGHEFRSALGFSRLKSTNFSISKSDGKLVFKGRGHGHGVGLCQWGARNLAEQGADFSGILKHYYPKARLLRRDTSPIQSL